MLVREGPATELAVATRILAHAGALAPEGRVAMLVGSDAVYLAARGVPARTMTPYDVAVVHLRDGTELAGDPPGDADRYLERLRASAGVRVVTLAADGSLAVAAGLRECVSTLLGRSWEDAEAAARRAGALVGAYPLES